MVDETLAVPVRPLPASRATTIGARVAEIGLGALALFFVWSDPAGNAWPAAALVAGLCLDGLGRIVGRIALSRARDGRPGLLPSLAIPSLVLASERGVLAAALLFAVAVVAWPDGFPILASLLAGILAMGGLARLAIARALISGEAADDDPDG